MLVAPPFCLGSAIITHTQPGCMNNAGQFLLLLKGIKIHISCLPGDCRLPWQGGPFLDFELKLGCCAEMN